MRQFLDETCWLITQAVKVVTTLWCISYGMSHWAQW